MPFWDRFRKKKPAAVSPIVTMEPIITFINAANWSESQRFLEQHPELLHSETDSLMQALAISLEDEQAKRVVEEHRALLARCREVGIEQAFAEKMRPTQAQALPEGIPPTITAIIAFVKAENWNEAQRILEQHPELLHPETDSSMQALVMSLEDEWAERQVEERRALLARCREVGIKQAFVEKMHPAQAQALPGDIAETIVAFINVASWSRAQRFLEQHPQLLHPEADSVMRILVMRLEDEGMKRRVEERRALLARCREVGIEQAFVEKMPIEDIMPTIMAFIEAETWQESQRIVEQHPELLRPEADSMMQAMALVEEHRALLARCREVGIEQAFAEKMRPTHDRPLKMRPARVRLEDIESLLLPLTIATVMGDGASLGISSDLVLRLAMAAATRDQTQLDALFAEHPELLALLEQMISTPATIGEQGGGEDIPPDITADIVEAHRLQAQTQRDPQTIDPLIQVCERILKRLQPGEHPTVRAAVQITLGGAYYNRLTGDRGANLTRAIVYFEEALRVYTPETAPREYVVAQFSMGTAYAALPTGDRGTNLARAITCFQEVLRFWTAETAPNQYAETQNNLGVAYTKLPTGDRGTNLTQAITCFQEALRFRTPETAPYYYAQTQNNLGGVYGDLPTGDRGTNLTQAITCFQEALRFWTLEVAPREYAMTQNNLGNAYRDLPTGDRGANLARAIAYFEEALRVYTPETAPHEYATTQVNLGIVYRIIPTGEPTLTSDFGANLARAIACYQEALRIWTPETAPHEYATTQNSLGTTYTELLTGDQEENLTRAIACYQEALRFQTQETAPREYAITQNGLGAAYIKLPTGDRGKNLAQAIACFQQALRIFTPETAPRSYAQTQINLGAAYRALPTGDQEENLTRAIACFQEALRFQTPETAPNECRWINHTLADLYIEQQDWDSAVAAYRAAMGAAERLYRAGLSPESKRTEVAENAFLYQDAAFAAAHLGNPAEALLILERGKTRLLAEALHLRVSRPAGLPDAAWAAFEWAGTAVRLAQSGFIAMLPSEQHNPIQTYAAREQAARAANAALDAAVAGIREYAPDYLKEIDLPAMQALLSDDHTALVAFCVTLKGSMGFVLSRDHDQAVRMVNLPAFTYADLRRLFVDSDTNNNLIGGWMVDYIRYVNEKNQPAFDTWLASIEHTLVGLGQCLLAPILAVLPPSIERLIFLPSGQLFLLPLHAVPLSDDNSDRVCDRYEVSYAPSAQVLVDCQAKVARAGGNDLYAVINPEEDRQLVFTPIEGAAIAGIFTRREICEGRAGTKAAVVDGVHGRTYVHFACHGVYNWRNPLTSGLTLADGRLTLDDLQRGVADLSSARLVTLSACETGMTDVMFKIGTEEYVGVPAGFMLAGVPCVVSSLWEVPDISTALLMERFYRNHLKDGMGIAAALREAQRWIRDATAHEMSLADRWKQIYHASDSHDANALRWMRYYQAYPDVRPFAHPYYWAAFTVNGM